MLIISPFISIVIPTRDRPEFVRYSLYYLAQQSFKNFEVIVADNFINASCKNEFEAYKNDKRFHYFQPETPLPMADNWEFAVSKANGQYVTVISEKYLFRSDALEVLHAILLDKPADLVSWWNETVTVTKSGEAKLLGKYIPKFKPRKATYFSPIEVLSKRFSFNKTPYSRNLGPKECLGKIYSGCFSRNLLDKMKVSYGRIFQPLMPDITSMTAALSLLPRCLDLGQPLMLVCASPEISNGFQAVTNTKKFKDFFSDYNLLKFQQNKLPLEGIGVALNNFIAHDFLYFQKLSDNNEFKKLSINTSNLLVRVKEDIDRIEYWDSEEEKSATYTAWQVLVDKCSKKKQKYIYYKLKKNDSAQPSLDEISFAGGQDIGTYISYVSAKERAEINWLKHQVFRIQGEYLNYNLLEDAMNYYAEYYQESAKLLKI